MLTPEFYRDYRVLPTGWTTAAARVVFAGNAGLASTRFHVEGWENLPRGPALLATNSTQKNDFMALRWVADRRGRRMVTVTKAKNYHDPVMGFLLKRLGVVPIASKGYFLLLEFTDRLGRRPTDAEYRALRDHVDRGEPLPAGEPYDTLRTRPHRVLGRDFDPGREAWRDFQHRLYAESLAETLRLAREAAQAGYDVQMYPEGTVAPRLGRGRHGAVQLAWALGLPLVPVGMSGCPGAFAGDSPLLKLRGGDITLRIGAPLSLPADFLPADFRPFDPRDEAAYKAALDGYVAGSLMPALDALLDPPFRHVENDAFVGKGTRAFL